VVLSQSNVAQGARLDALGAGPRSARVSDPAETTDRQVSHTFARSARVSDPAETTDRQVSHTFARPTVSPLARSGDQPQRRGDSGYRINGRLPAPCGLRHPADSNGLDPCPSFAIRAITRPAARRPFPGLVDSAFGSRSSEITRGPKSRLAA
jgi:hypothetical protein